MTAPFKLDAFAYATDLSEQAQLAGAVNALAYARGLGRAVLTEGGRIFTGSGVTGCIPRDGKWAVTTQTGEVLAEHPRGAWRNAPLRRCVRRRPCTDAGRPAR